MLKGTVRAWHCYKPANRLRRRKSQLIVKALVENENHSTRILVAAVVLVTDILYRDMIAASGYALHPGGLRGKFIPMLLRSPRVVRSNNHHNREVTYQKDFFCRPRLRRQEDSAPAACTRKPLRRGQGSRNRK